MSNYEVHASPFFLNVTCPKHRRRMEELKTGLLEERYWWCDECGRPYHLKPTAVRAGTYDAEEIMRQLTKKDTQ